MQGNSRLNTLFFVSLFLILLSGSVAIAQDSKTKVVWWTEGFSTDNNQWVIDNFVNPFNASQDAIELEMVFQPAEELNSLLRTAIQGDQAPDILQTPGPAYVKEYYDAGLLTSMQAFSEQYGWGDKLLPWALATGSFDGELYAIPLTYESLILLYNKTLFEEKGWTPPTNLAEMEALAAEMEAAGIVPISYGSADWNPTHEHLVGIYYNNYAGPENVYAALNGDMAWTDPVFAESLNLLNQHMLDKNWYSGGLENYYAYGTDDMFNVLASGEGAMMLTGTWNFRNAVDFFSDSGSEWDWAPLPVLSDNLENYNYQLAVGGTLSINAASEHPEAAAQVLEFLLSDRARVLTVASGYGFGEWVVPLSYTEEDFPTDTDPRVVRFFADFAQVTGEGRYGYTTWTFFPVDANLHVWKAMELVWAGDITVEDYLAQQQALWDEARANNETLRLSPR